MDSVAPAGYLWVCCACGKTSKDKYGGPTASEFWDESCMLNSNLFPEKDLVFNEDGTRVIKVLPPAKFDAEGTCLQCKAKLGTHHKMDCSYGQGPVTIPVVPEEI